MTKRTKIFLIVLALLVILAAASYYIVLRLFDIAPPPAPETSPGLGSLYGRVTAAGGGLLPGPEPIRGAQVSLEPGGFATRTDKEGAYFIGSIPPGTYTFTFSAPGYETQVISPVRALPGQPQLVEGSLFSIPRGPAAARLALTTAMGMGRAPEEHAYNSTVYIDAGKSENASREGFRWEIYGPKGELVEDPLNPGRPLAPVPSQMPGSSPYVFTFVPPAAGEYTVRLHLSNNLYPQEDTAAVAVRAVNVPPEAYPSVYPGPLPPSKEGRVFLSASRGLKVVEAGAQVYLRGFAVDKNYPSPELYNPGGAAPDIYGQNYDHFQRAFSWRWELFLIRDGGEEQDLSDRLRTPAGTPGTSGQHLSFTAAEPGAYRACLVVNDNDPYGALESKAASVEILVQPKTASIGESRCLQCHQSGGRSKTALPTPGSRLSMVKAAAPAARTAMAPAPHTPRRPPGRSDQPLTSLTTPVCAGVATGSTTTGRNRATATVTLSVIPRSPGRSC
jgi:mono/diheme cytochrome c family protein